MPPRLDRAIMTLTARLDAPRKRSVPMTTIVGKMGLKLWPASAVPATVQPVLPEPRTSMPEATIAPAMAASASAPEDRDPRARRDPQDAGS